MNDRFSNCVRHQDLVTMKLPRHVRDTLKELAAKQHRSMVKQIEFMINEEVAKHE